MKIFVITLENSIDRQKSIKLQFQKINFPFEFIYGIDGKKLSKAELNQYYDDAIAKKYCGRSLELGEIGCAISHRLVYKKMIDENIDRAIILEDDALLENDFTLVINLLSKLRINKFVIKLDLHNEMKKIILPCHKIWLNNKYKIVHSTTTGFARGYYIDYMAAIAMLEFKKIFFFADSWDVFRNSIRLRILDRSIIGLDEHFTSTIWGENEYRPCSPRIYSNFFLKISGKFQAMINILYMFFH
jgi:GR25 family glycosyltransferase involved in LPS biosynthesis